MSARKQKTIQKFGGYHIWKPPKLMLMPTNSLCWLLEAVCHVAGSRLARFTDHCLFSSMKTMWFKGSISFVCSTMKPLEGGSP